MRLDPLTRQLRDNGVGFDHDAPEQLEAALAEAVADAESELGSEIGLVVMDQTPGSLADLRDLAQDLLYATGDQTVIIRTPQAAIAVSDELTRAQIEVGERAMVAQPDYAEGVRAFFSAANGFAVPWVPFALGVLCVAAVIIAASVKASR